MRCIELFTGIGGSALGVARAGVTHILAIERDPSAINALKRNRTHFAQLDCSLEISHSDVADITERNLGCNWDILVAGSPCQPFSISGKQHGHEDERNGLKHVLRIAKQIRPKCIVLENVAGLASPKFRAYFSNLLEGLRTCGTPSRSTGRKHNGSRAGHIDSDLYEVHWTILESADFGIPQMRRRIFVVCLRRPDIVSPFVFPPASHSYETLVRHQVEDGIYWREHSILPPPIFRSFVPERSISNGDEPPPLDRWVTLRDALRVLRGADLPGNDPWHVLRKGARIYHGHTGSLLDLPSKTIKAGVHGVPGGENMIRISWRRARYLTVRECGLIQGFPLTYQFSDKFSTSMRLIGNAVPAALAEAVIRVALKSISCNGQAFTGNGRTQSEAASTHGERRFGFSSPVWSGGR